MKKVLLAVGHIGLENYIKTDLSRAGEFEFVGESVHRENILALIKETSPDILVLRETLPGKANIISLVYTIRSLYQNIRIVFLAGEREVGDELLSTLVNYGVYDILHSGKLLAKDIIALIRNPNTYKDVKHLQPVPVMEAETVELEFVIPESTAADEPLPETSVEEDEDEEEEEETDNFPKIEFVLPEKNPFEAFEALEAARQERIKKAEAETTIPSISEVKETKKEEKQPSATRVTSPTKEEPPPKEEPTPKEERQNLLRKIKLPNTTKRTESSAPQEEKKKLEIPRFGEVLATKKIITFWGTKGGVGTSTLAHNLAISLANDNKKVLYVELDDTKPSVAYWYDLGLLSEGIDTLSRYISRKEYRNIASTLVKGKDIKPSHKKYSAFPETLDFLFYSKEYLSGVKPREKECPLKDIYLYLFYQGGYDFVILDVGTGVGKEDLVDLLMFSNLIYIVASQDVSGLGYHVLDLNNLFKGGINIRTKSYYIINKYINSLLGVKKIKKWLEVENLTLISDERETHINAIAEGQPLITQAREGKPFKEKIEELKKLI